MDRADALRDALKSAEEALGWAVERYRLALGCCCSCGDFFEPGDVAVALVDRDGHIIFEHDECPDDASSVRQMFETPDQSGLT